MDYKAVHCELTVTIQHEILCSDLTILCTDLTIHSSIGLLLSLDWFGKMGSLKHTVLDFCHHVKRLR